MTIAGIISFRRGPLLFHNPANGTNGKRSEKPFLDGKTAGNEKIPDGMLQSDLYVFSIFSNAFYALSA